ncbi:hypothetical protein [Paenisporosarcina cavernae]|uniref:Uncharacterized protein n=1 Tax=Paenisporosarcina cavernae TaxID=2320858 RepID=A0A385YWB6_9BACL|nr:hypothetical protein [Paenisporosarcina cavernae]AYC30197.1 hypothetical protein D3873_10065 [Paenisporosarcina cavernae]
MKLNTIAGEKWWKIGAAAFLSVGLLAACGDGEDQDNVDEEEIQDNVDDAENEVDQEMDAEQEEDQMDEEEDAE